MQIIPISELYGYHFSAEVVNTRRVYWHKSGGDTFSSFGMPKKANLLVYLDNCSAEYTLLDGQTLHAGPGSLVYTPMGSQYKLRIHSRRDASSGTVGTNFFLYDTQGEPFLLSDTVMIFSDIACKQQIDALESLSNAMLCCPSRMKAQFYELLMLVCERSRATPGKKFGVIRKGIRYMEQDHRQQLSIPEVAALCSVSEIYFRRLFKEYSGLSPTEYRMRAKMERAKNHLLYDDLTTAQISALLGFEAPSYFCRQFKKHTGLSPQEYRRQHFR